jgi:hypothetical protein
MTVLESITRITRFCFISLSLGGCVTGTIEEPKYKIIETEGDFEIREYAPRIVAETLVSEAFDRAPNVGFRRLADYIFGNNESKQSIAMTSPVAQEPQSEKIAMTAPVGQERAKDNLWVITFTMPSSYNMETLPKPKNPEVILKQLPASKFAAVRFTGFNRAQTVNSKTQELTRWLAKKSLQAEGQPIYARYNPPWTPWFMRRNEILLEIK